jgi:two-component system OmpR family sensor kinase
VSYVWWLYGAFVVILGVLFISIALSLYPLRGLQRHIRRFGEGDLNESFELKGKNEIAEVSREFNKAAQRIKDLIQGRAIFLRNITHELKTPITKGKLSLEFLESSRSKNILDNVFTRLDLLTREFLQIEKITACDYDIETKPYHVSEVLTQALELLFLEPNSIENNLDDLILDIDFDLFAIVFKNLIDNGIKYGENRTVRIDYHDDEIAFVSEGKPLAYDLGYYMQPFNKCDINPDNSFGLGLYLVDYILQKHGFSFAYRHDEGLNKFIIVLKTSS